MSLQMNLHDAAREIFDCGLRAVDAGKVIRRVTNLNDPVLRICDWVFDVSFRRAYVIAIGKAAPAMVESLAEIIRDRITAGVVSGPGFSKPRSLDSNRWRVFAGGHPLPNQGSLDAAEAAFYLLHEADEARALIIFLISGGGSAMIEWPSNSEITLSDLREANRQLICCGATIAEINAVRRAFSAVKGGKLAALAPHAAQVTLIISDTNSGEEAGVASGPTLSPAANSPDPVEVINRYRLDGSLPESILAAVVKTRNFARALTGEDKNHYVLLNNQTAIQGAAARARQLGFIVEVAPDVNEQEIREGSSMLVSRLHSLWKREGQKQKPVCLLAGGEFSCLVRGQGLGGRNLETALRCAIEFDKHQQGDLAGVQLIALSAGTDGIDGNSSAAGAIADETTISRAVSKRLDPEDFLARSDSFSFFNALGDVIVTGPTGTNVRDLRILLASGV